MKKTTTNKNSSQKLMQQTSFAVPINPVQTPEQHSAPFFTDDILKKIFFFSLLGMLFITLVSGYNSGFNSDEIEMNNYGRANFAYYATGGKDTSLMSNDFRLIKYYGNAYEMIAVGINKIIGLGNGPNEFNVRHIVNQVIGIIGLLYAGLTARKLGRKWQAAIASIWLLFLTPSFMGHFLFNTRDIPFCTGYIATIYFIFNFLEELPAPTWKTTLKIMVAFAFTTNIRIGGFLLLFYMLLFMGTYLLTNKQLLLATIKNLKEIIIKFAVIVVGGTSIIILTWPFILKHPAALIEAFGVAKKFPLKVMINFEGGTIDSLKVPSHYIPKFMLITIPVFVIVCIIGGVALYFVERKKFNWKFGVFGLFAILFPVVYAVTSNAALYSSWRHFLFVFPLMCVFGGIFFTEILLKVRKPVLKIALFVVCLTSMIKPILFCINNNPYEYCYFNEIAGNFKNAFYNYDSDYWAISVKKGLDWLIEHEHLAQAKDTVNIASNAQMFVTYYLQKHCPNPKLKVLSSGVTGRNELFWTYAVYSSLFVKPDYLENFFPPAQTIHTETVEGMPVTVVLKDLNRLDYKALDALKLAKHREADSLYTAYIATTKDHNPAIDAYISVAKGSTNQNDAAILAANRELQYHFSNVLDYNAYCGLGIAYANTRQYAKSIEALKTAEKLMPKEHYSKDILVQVYRVMQLDKQQVQQAQSNPHP